LSWPFAPRRQYQISSSRLSRPSIGFRASTAGPAWTLRDGSWALRDGSYAGGGTSRGAGEVAIGSANDFDFRMLKLQGLDAR